jgi:putative ABC transport system permease protein
MQDLRFALRQLLKSPGFTAVAVLTLALGIGANTAIFSFVNAVLLRPLPYQEPDRLVVVYENNVERDWHKNAVAAPVLGEWRQRSQTFEGLAAYKPDLMILTGKGQPETLTAVSLSANIFSLLGVQPMLGRGFLPEEETYGKHQVVVLSYDFWNRRFAHDPGIIGQTVTFDSDAYQVVGIMPPHRSFPDGNAQVWLPLAFTPERLAQRHNHSYNVCGRLKPGVTLAQARADMDLVSSRMAEADPQNKGWGAELFPLQEIMVGDSRPVLLVLLGSVGLVLLIACANIANLLLARAAARSREFAIRAALGAGRRQIVRQLLVESLVLAVSGGVAGLALGQAALELLLHFSPPNLPRLWEGISLDGTTLAFTLGLTLATGVLFGLVPALQTARSSLNADLNDSSRGSSASHQRRRTRAALVIAEMALSLVLLIGAGLLVRSFDRLLSKPLGFVPEHVVTMTFSLPDKTYPGQAEKTRFFDQLLAQTRALPGVDSAALIYGLPLSGRDSSLSVDVVGAAPAAPGESVSAGYSQISAGYFRTLNMPLLQGRDFNELDQANSPAVVIVDEAFVKNFKLGDRVLGRHINVSDGGKNAEIVGVVPSVKRLDLTQAPQGELYRAYRQNCWGFLDLTVRTRRDPAELMRVMRGVVDGLDKNLPIEHPRTLTELVASSVADRRLSVQLLAGFAGVALLLASVGLYGVLAFNVTQRRREIGIRMALGAQRADVLRLVLQHGMTLVVVGMAVGLAGALALARFLGSLLFEIKPNDPLTFVLVPLVLGVVALLACWLPARRAARVDPMVALRSE